MKFMRRIAGYFMKENPIQEPLGKARDALGAALRAMRENEVHVKDATAHGAIENAFTETHTALTGNQTELEHLAIAVKGLDLAVNALCAHSLKDGADLTAAREALAAAKAAQGKLAKLAPE